MLEIRVTEQISSEMGQIVRLHVEPSVIVDGFVQYVRFSEELDPHVLTTTIEIICLSNNLNISYVKIIIGFCMLAAHYVTLAYMYSKHRIHLRMSQHLYRPYLSTQH